jgi:DNA-binding transcriptional MerR regulator
LPLHPHALDRPNRIAQILNVDKSTLWRWEQRGLLPSFVRIGGSRGLTGEYLLKRQGRP